MIRLRVVWSIALRDDERRAQDDRNQGHRHAGRPAAVRRGARGAARDGPPLRQQGDRAQRRRVGGGARIPPRALRAAAPSSASSGSSSPRSYGGQGGTHLHDAIWVEELARSGGSGGVAAGLNAHTSIAMPPIFNFGTEEQKQRWLVPGHRRREDRRARDHRARRRLRRRRHLHLRREGRRRLRRQRLEDLHHQRRPRRLPRLRREDDQRGRPRRHLLPRARARDARLRGGAEAGEDGLALLRHGRAGLHRRRGARGEPARRARTRASS